MCHARLHRRHQSFQMTTHDCPSTRGKKLGIRGRFIRIRHDDEDWGTFSALASSFGHSVSLPLLHSLASSSEYNVFLLSVPALPGGPCVSYGFWILTSVFAWVRLEQPSFVQRNVKEEKTFCGTVGHVSKFSVKEDGAYIQASENHVLCNPCLVLSGFSDYQRAKLFSVTKTVTEWNMFIKDMAEGIVPDWLVDVRDETKMLAILCFSCYLLWHQNPSGDFFLNFLHLLLIVKLWKISKKIRILVEIILLSRK